MPDKIMFIGDLHFGNKNNSEVFCQQLVDFIGWAKDYAEQNGVRTIVQGGDWFHTRTSLNILTLNYSNQAVDILSNGNFRTLVLVGNHDIYYHDRRDVHSLNKTLRPLEVIEHPTMVTLDSGHQLVICPWVTEPDDWERVLNMASKARVLFGHFELDSFKMTGTAECRSEYKPSHLKKYGLVVSGHFHSYQKKGNIVYPGTPVPNNMGEANEDHGILLIDPDTLETEFVPYTRTRAVIVRYEELETRLPDIMKETPPEGICLRVEYPDTLDDPSVIEECSEALVDMGFQEVSHQYQPRTMTEILEEASEFELEEVDNIDALIQCLLESEDFDMGDDRISKKVLLELYKQAVQRGENG